MTDENEGDAPQWMKRLKWAHTGMPSLDERINAIASLWAEGALQTVEIGPQAHEAIRLSAVRPESSDESTLEVYAKNARIASQWSALLHVMHFCEEHRWKTQDERVAAFRLFETKLDGTEGASSSRPWIADACDRLTRVGEADEPVSPLFRRWLAGEVDSPEDLIKQSAAVQATMQKQFLPDPEAPESSVESWIDGIRSRAQLLVLRETDAYCRAAGLNTREKRVQAWQNMLDELERPGPTRRTI